MLTIIGNHVIYAIAIIVKIILLATISLLGRIKIKIRSYSYNCYLNYILPNLVIVASKLDIVTSSNSSLSYSAQVELIL